MPAAMQAALVRHDEIVRRRSTRTAATSSPRVATASARRSSARQMRSARRSTRQRGLAAEPWSPERRSCACAWACTRVRPTERDGDYFGPPVNRAARVMGAGIGGQIVASSVTAALIGPVPGIELVDLGEHVLKGLREPTHVFGVAGVGLRLDRPAARPAHLRATSPSHLTDFVGDLTSSPSRSDRSCSVDS